MRRWALVIGASGDIGAAVAAQLAADGWSLYLHYHKNAQRVATACAELAAAYPKQDFLSLQYDLTDGDHLDDLVGQLFAVDAVIFAAGQTYYHLFKATTQAELAALAAVHLLTPMALVAKLQDKLASSGHGRVIFIGSVYGGSGSAMEVAYSTVKGGQSAFVHAYAKEVASLGITANVVAPGAVATKMNRTFDAATLAAVEADIPAGRFAKPADVRYFVRMLLDPAADYLTGQTLYVTGGWLQ
ncbi:elongation factor P 5-aminopentanone reductase [Lacticaseibacillus suihuaensis]